MSVVQMIALYLGRAMFEFLDGTGFKEDLDDVFTRLQVTLQSKRFASVRNLERKLVAIHDSRFLYDDQIDDVNDILTALIKEEQLHIVYRRGNTKGFAVDPYTLLVHRGGLYLVAFSHKHGEVRTFQMTPEEYGLKRADCEDIVGGNAAENAKITRSILEGEKGPRRDMVLLNASAAFVASGICGNISEGLQVAADAIDSGKARQKLDDLIDFTRQCQPYIRKAF